MAKFEMEIQQDFKEIVDFLIDGILDKVLRGASLDEYVAALPQLMVAADGYKAAFDSMSGAQRNECLAYALYRIAEVAAPDDLPEEVPVVEAPPAE
jgi:hypothetical protein